MNVALIVGICCDADFVFLNKRKTSPNLSKCISIKSITDIEMQSKPTSLDLFVVDGEEETLVNLLVVYLIMTILFLNISLNTLTSTAHYPHNLASFGCYVWEHATHWCLMVDVPTIVARVQLRYKGKFITGGYLKWCAITLNIGFFELTRSVKKQHLRRT